MPITKKRESIRKLTELAILTAIVLVLQLFASVIRIGPFSITLVLIPIIIGAATLDPLSGAWLGFVFGVAVLLSGDAAFFLGFSVPGTVATVLIKGTLCGLAAGLVYRALAKKKRTLAVYTAAVVCPVVNTGTFLICSRLFLYDAVKNLAAQSDWKQGIFLYMIIGMVGINFVVEFVIDIVLAPAIVRILDHLGHRSVSHYE